MKTLSLDYERDRSRAAELVRATLLASGLAVLAVSTVACVERWSELAAMRERAEDLRLMARRSAGALRARPEDTQEVEAEVHRANAVLEQINLPWLELLDAIQSTRGETVALLSIQPDARRHTVRIAAEAKSLGEALEYVRRLAAHPRLNGVYLVNHEMVQQDAQKPVRFQLLAGWRSER